MAGLICPRWDAYISYSGWGVNVGTAEDGNPPDGRPQAATAESDDAVDDAHNVCLLLSIIPQWPGSLLGDFQYYYYWHAVFCYRLGRSGQVEGG